MKIVNTKELIALNEHAISLDYNRTLNPDLLTERADPDGLHVISQIMIHEHAQGVQVDPHLRCHVLIKIRDQESPTEAFLDVTMEDYNALADGESAKTLTVDFVNRWNASLRSSS